MTDPFSMSCIPYTTRYCNISSAVNSSSLSELARASDRPFPRTSSPPSKQHLDSVSRHPASRGCPQEQSLSRLRRYSGSMDYFSKFLKPGNQAPAKVIHDHALEFSTSWVYVKVLSPSVTPRATLLTERSVEHPLTSG